MAYTKSMVFELDMKKIILIMWCGLNRHGIVLYGLHLRGTIKNLEHYYWIVNFFRLLDFLSN